MLGFAERPASAGARLKLMAVQQLVADVAHQTDVADAAEAVTTLRDPEAALGSDN